MEIHVLTDDTFEEVGAQTIGHIFRYADVNGDSSKTKKGLNNKEIHKIDSHFLQGFGVWCFGDIAAVVNKCPIHEVAEQFRKHEGGTGAYGKENRT